MIDFPVAGETLHLGCELHALLPDVVERLARPPRRTLSN